MRIPRSVGLFVALAVTVLSWPLSGAAQGPDDDLGLITGAGGTLFTAWVTDAAVFDEMYRAPGSSLDGLARLGTMVGSPTWFLSGLGSLYLGGKLVGHSGLSEGALHATAALLASGVVNGSLKFALGRCRPDADVDCSPRDFRGFELEDHLQSFPSGHAVVAFSLATTLAHKVDSPWIGALGYGAATVVGWSRVHRGRHWMSDTVGGAIVGVTMSRLTLGWLDSRGTDEVDRFRVGVVPGGFGITFPVRFSRR